MMDIVQLYREIISEYVVSDCLNKKKKKWIKKSRETIVTMLQTLYIRYLFKLNSAFAIIYRVTYLAWMKLWTQMNREPCIFPQLNW